MKWLFTILTLSMLSGCGGFRGGVESVPYVGGIEPQQSSTNHAWPHEITLPGLSLHLSLNNRVRTYQYEVMLYIIPTYLNFWDEFQDRDAESLELTVQIIAHGSAVTIDPRQLTMTVDGKEFYPTAVWVNNLDRERQVIDTYVRARHQASPEQPPPLPRSAQWRDAVTAPAQVNPEEKSPRFIVTFPIPLPSPESTLSLDLNPSIIAPMPAHIPLIRFKSLHWSGGYS